MFAERRKSEHNARTTHFQYNRRILRIQSIMGYFSKLCAKTFLPVMAVRADVPELSRVVALFPNGKIVMGVYDGYGRVDDLDMDYETFESIKFVLANHYAGETYDALGESPNDPGQGWFYNDADLRAWIAKGGFSSADEHRRHYDAANSAGDEADDFDESDD